MTELAHIRPRSEADFDPGLTAAQMDLLKRTVAADVKPPLTDDELRLFARVAALKGLDPFARQIHVTKRQGKLVIQTGIDGYRLIAERSGRWEGIDGPWWCGPDGQWTDVWLSTDPPAAAKVVAYKHDARPRTGIAHWSEYAQYTTDDGGRRLNRMWQTMPAGQLAKCAEALALRAQFPQDLSGIYTDEEMGQADGESPGAVQVTRAPAAPGAAIHGAIHTTEQGIPTGFIIPTLPQVKRVRFVRDAKALIQAAPPDFQALVPRAIHDVHHADPHAFWDDPARKPTAWTQVLEYAVELYEQQQHETSAGGALAPPGPAADTQSGPVPGSKGKAVGPGSDNPEES